MTLEDQLFALLGPLLNGRFYPDTLPDHPSFPAASYQAAGGVALWFGERALPDHRNARVQINIHARTRAEASALAHQMAKDICTGFPVAKPYGEPVSTYSDVLKLYSARQDFGIWYPDNT